ncbi:MULTISPECIES: M28 family metallopeptidase [unclassified Cellulophaga]|uniref:M28 family metallopeptidase n=1 Tax=unclassified Cellulophaga TaxID=2634405 RepID=UPI0026E18802|nr:MULTISPECIES: M28 family peptidase [unclassified Cellulophaga]MDO6490489.1 M20/M25/M40 family metallo-hydrolase [Cellulophaga sp. 2_MG-2023]MDO6494317.1 M20/M25/M40 family metallo-hydrolase [Cellulophaga sp. 3_MG-2023]
MKKTFYFLGLLAIVSCSSRAQEVTVDNKIATTAAEVEKIVAFLASDDLQGRMSGTEGIAEAASFIENNFKSNGVKPYFSSYKDTLTNFDASKGVAYNIVGYIEGTDPKLKNEVIILGAHYDHIGSAKADGDDVIANGANDNASGTSAVMEFARYFGKTKANKRSIIFALFSAEEMGLLGSKHLAKKLKKENLNLYAMLNFEMIGIPMQNKDYLTYLTGFNESNLAKISNNYAGENIAGFLPKAGEFRLFMRSDNYPFHQEFNVPSQTYSTFDFTNFEHYHKVGDEPSVMDFNHMASLINKFVPVIKGIVNSDTKEIKYN